MILIRADANEKIGTGHVMRCLSIAHEFAELGHEVLFITSDHRGDGLVNSAGFKNICMDSEWTEMEQEPIKDIISFYHPSLLLVDSYFVTEKYLSAVSALTRTAYIDDMNVSRWNVDYLIDYNIFGPTLDYSSYKNTRTKLLLGPVYAPLRPEFRNMPVHIIKPVSDIFISAGGSDPEGITETLMSGICSQWSEVHFHFVIGALNPRLSKIKSLVKDNIILHINEKNMSGLMQSCDVAISAAGSTLYELCACGIPTITYTLADNQIFVAEEFQRQKIMISAGDCRRDDRFVCHIKECLQNLISNVDLRGELSEKMQRVVDGNGAKKIAMALM